MSLRRKSRARRLGTGQFLLGARYVAAVAVVALAVSGAYAQPKGVRDKCDIEGGSGDVGGTGVSGEREFAGACCLPDGTCVMMPVVDCVAQGGVPQGAQDGELVSTVELQGEFDCHSECCPGEELSLSAGVWEVVVADNPNNDLDALSIWANDEVCVPPDGSRLCWLWRVVITTPGEEILWRPTGFLTGYYETQQEALAANLGKSTTFILDEPATVSFWIDDYPCNDNRGGVTFDVREYSPGACTTPEACCFPDDTCAMADPLCCDDLGGAAQGAGSGCGGMQACCSAAGACYMADAVCCVANGDTPKGAGSVCLGDGNGDGKDDVCVVPPVGCCWRCEGDQVQCNNGVTHQACPSGWHWVQSAFCGTSSCGEGTCDQGDIVPAVSAWGLAVLVLVLL